MAVKQKASEITRILRVASRECGILATTPIYFFCMVIFPIITILFFTFLLDSGQPQEMPIGVVDLDNTSTTRALIRRLDGMQTSHVAAYFATPADARKAIQRNKIYAFLYIPQGTTENLLSARQPKVSFYYTGTSLTAAAMLMRDLKTVCTLGSAAVGQAAMQARGFTQQQITTFLQPIAVDLHAVGNPWTSYNIYLSTFIIPGILLLFIFLISAYSIGTELKFHRSQELMKLSGNDIYAAIIGKFLPQTLIWLIIVYGYMWYVFGHLGFPHPGGTWLIALIGLLAVLASEGFGIFIFGIIPSLRMSMSICSLWAMLGFSMAGSAFPMMGMDEPLQSLTWLFPLRHYYMLYQITVFNGFPLLDAWFHFVALVAFMLSPWFVIYKIKNAMLTYVYIP